MSSHIIRYALVALILIAAAPVALAEKRVALVIGNDGYESVTKLRKAVNDARAMAATLKSLGFSVTEATDGSRRELNRAIQTFINTIEPGDVAMFFFAGHGVEIGGENFLLPTDIPNAAPGQEGFIRNEAISLNDILIRLKAKKSRLNLVVLDACRNNPFSTVAGRSLGASRGLARIAAPQGTFVMYSADAGEQALDRLDDSDRNPNSVFTRTLIPLMKTPGKSLVDIARQARRQVRQLALSVSHQQVPAYYDSVLGDFYFAGKDKPDGTTPGTSTQTAIERDFELARQIGTKAAWEAFLRVHGDKGESFHVQLAKAALKKLAVGLFPEKENPPEKETETEHKTFRDCDQCPEMVAIPVGSFTLGSPESERSRTRNESPQRRITFSKPFAMGKYEVTVGEFETFVRETGYRAGNACYVNGKDLLPRNYRKPGFAQDENHPAVCINWNDATAYVKWLSRKTGKRYRLPSEAEWEYAARAGTQSPYPTGDSITTDDANYNGIPFQGNPSEGLWRKQTTPAGTFAANDFGLHDMMGNASEWTDDCWNETHAGAAQNGTARRSGRCNFRVRRGGAWSDYPMHLRSATRSGMEVNTRHDMLGFRVVRVVGR